MNIARELQDGAARESVDAVVREKLIYQPPMLTKLGLRSVIAGVGGSQFDTDFQTPAQP